MHRSEAYGLKLFESTEWPTLREARIHRNDCSLAAFCGNYKQGDTRTRTLRHHIRQPCLTSAMLHKQSILCLLSYDAQRLYALCIQKLNPVGFCVICAFCGNYKQGDTRTRTLRHHRRQPCLTSAMLHKQSILCLLSYDAQRLYALCIPKA